MRFELLLLLALATFVVAQDEADLGELEDLGEFEDFDAEAELLEISDPVAAEEAAPAADMDAESAEDADIASEADIASSGKDKGEKCKVKSKGYGYDNKKSNKHEKGNCKRWLVCDLRYGKKKNEGKCRPKKSCAVKYQDCKKRGQYCRNKDNDRFWGYCRDKKRNGSECHRDYQCKSGNCKEKDNVYDESKCAKEDHHFGGHNNQNYDNGRQNSNNYN